MSVPGVYEFQAAEEGRAGKEVEACRDLWRKVLQYSILDYRYQQRFADVERPAKHEKERLNKISKSPPEDFFDSEWFDEICTYLEVDPVFMREVLPKNLEAAA